MLRLLMICVLLLALPSGALHEYYVSVARANYNAKDHKLEVGLKVFTDDLESTLQILAGEPIKLSDPKESAAAEEPLSAYLENRFVIMQGAVLQELLFLGIEAGPDETWLYFEIEMPPSGTFTVKNTLLFDVFPAQVNIIHFNVNDQQQSHYFTQDQPLIEVTF